jgi:hypothetical protein
LNGKDKISDNYRKQVDELLDNQSDLNLIDPLNQEELDKIWEEISTEMDIGQVWNNISSDLDTLMPVDSGSGIIVKSIAAVLIILFGMIPVKKAILNSGVGQPDIIIENMQNKQSAKLITKNIPGDSDSEIQVKGDISPALRSSLDISEDGNKPTLTKRNRTGMAPETPMPVSNIIASKVLVPSEMVDSNLFVSPDKIPIEKSDIPPFLYTDYLKKIRLLAKSYSDSLKINDNSSTTESSLPIIDRGRISGGLITLFKNTWLLNHETFDGFKSESLKSTEFVFFPDVGLSLSYSLNRTWLLQSDVFLSSNTGQEYLDYIYGHYSRKKITLNYSTIDLSVKHKFVGSNNFIPGSSINVIAGTYLSYLHYAHQKINTDLENIVSQYEKLDFGVIVGGEYELQIFDQLSVAPGLFLSLGIPNIYKGTINIPGYLRSTHNGSAEFHLVFYFHPD